jgi:medium-chain acyl-[acyl-carrier-protein] hydrolase
LTDLPTTVSRGSWLSCVSQPPDPECILFCFSHAGGGASVYSTWAPLLAPKIAVKAIQLPGRENRITEKPISSFPVIVNSIVDAIEGQIDRPFAFFGHSMGTLVALETARELRRRSLRQPVHLFVSGRHAPDLSSGLPPLHRLPDEEFLRECVRIYQGIPQAVLNEPELVAIFLPALRADLEAVETYKYQEDPPLACPITALFGTGDSTSSPELVMGWARQTRKQFVYKAVPGAHLYLQSARSEILATLRQSLAGYTSNPKLST